MPCSEPPRLPTELIELIIDEVPRLSHSSNYSRACTFSALASVSHLFRQCSNKHRFACVSLQRRPLATRAHLFLDVAQSTIWTGSNGISSHIKTLSLGVAVRGEGNALTLHPALLDGTLTSIIREVFRGNPARTEGNQLILSTHTSQRFSAINANELGRFDWSLLPSEFLGAVQTLCRGSHLTNLHLQWFANIPTNWLTLTKLKRLKLDQVHFSVDKPVDAWVSFPALSILDIRDSSSFIESLPHAQIDFDNLKMLRYTIDGPRDALIFMKIVMKAPHLETLQLRIDCETGKNILSYPSLLDI